jgi:hypothetical protein
VWRGEHGCVSRVGGGTGDVERFESKASACARAVGRSGGDCAESDTAGWGQSCAVHGGAGPGDGYCDCDFMQQVVLASVVAGVGSAGWDAVDMDPSP